MPRQDSIPFRQPGKYRRAFDWRLSVGDRASLKVPSAAMTALASSDYPDILEDFLEISRKRRNNRTALAKLQLHMLEEVMIQEAAVKHYKQELANLEEGSDSDPERPEQIELCERELFFYRLYANAVRAIGDGIAWRALGYDRAVSRLMSARATKQTLLAEGTIHELSEWSFHFDNQIGLPILNALTNCLAVGDVTVVRNDDSVEIIEVKASNTKSSRKIRQKQKMSEVVTLLGAGAGKTEDKDLQIEVLPIEPETGLDQIAELLAIAEKKGWASRRISNCLYVEAVDFAKIEGFDDIRQEKLSNLRAWRGDFIHDLSSLDNLTFGPNCAPFSVFPFDSRTCVELLIGAKSYWVHLNVEAVAREFEYRGWRIDKTSKQLIEEGNTEALLVVSKNGFHVHVPPADFMRMELEALRPKTLIEGMEYIYKQGPGARHKYTLALYSGESGIWN